MTAAGGEAAEAILWGIVARLRAQGRPVSLREIQRAQDVIAYLVTRLGRPPTDDELRRHLQPLFCGRDRDLTPFAEVFRDSAPDPEPGDDSPAAAARWWRRIPPAIAAVGIALAMVSLLQLVLWLWTLNPAAGTSTGTGNTGGAADTNPGWTSGLWVSVAGLVVATVAVSLLAFRKRLRRRPGASALEPVLDLGWETALPLAPDVGARVARVLRARTREPGRGTLDVPRTIDATLRAGLRLTPRFVEYKRTPEYLAVIEQRSAGDVLAGHYARMVDQLTAQGVGMRRAGLQPRSPLVIDPERGPRHLESLQPASERERLLLFAADWPLRDPLTGADRPWLDRFDQWAETIRIDPDVHRTRPLRVVDRVLDDVRALDPSFARTRGGPAAAQLPFMFESGDLVWIEPIPPPRDELLRVMDLLVTTLGPAGWYWLSACALYPEISYELTVTLGRLIHADDGRPLADHVPIEVLARLPWFRHAYMPDWLRASLIGTLSRGQLVEARAALDQTLTSGLGGPGAGLTVTESGPGPTTATGTTDRVYLEATGLRRQKLAASAPKALVTAIRHRRHRLAMPGLAFDAPSPRVRRALVAGNALIAGSVLLVALANLASLLVTQRVGAYRFWGELWSFAMILAATFSGVLSAAAGRWRGFLLGSGVTVLTAVAWSAYSMDGLDRISGVPTVAEPFIALVWTTAVLVWPFKPSVVAWPTFQRRNRAVYYVSCGVVVFVETIFALAQSSEGGTTLASWQSACVVCLLFAGTAASLGAAYAGGVRVVPAAMAGVLLVSVAVLFDSAEDRSAGLFLAVPAIVMLAAFAVRLHRHRDRPPLEFAESWWYQWRSSMMVAVPGLSGVVGWIVYGGDLEGAAWFGGVPALFALLHVIGNRFGAFAARNRLSSRLPLHFD
ncbi:hypothetical protein BJ973_001710 [Actinoplanes tereljensis]|uniref:Uncharacterized protein n=1 Tax=Paractinoplanes tereljensis TaxID=571912 RepID=A0A919NLL6_9ACTN|nr:hypothetical protein [Actinoplanes tereljensis]GIF20385.1 hypothetical protein Ate02nite_31150 [Actinoplanes tereljensis]